MRLMHWEVLSYRGQRGVKLEGKVIFCSCSLSISITLDNHCPHIRAINLQQEPDNQGRSKALLAE